MAFTRRSGSSNVAPATVKRRSGSSWVDVQNIYRRSGSSWVLVWSAYTPVTATITATSVNYDTHGVGVLKIGTSTLNASGGTGSYTYSVARISGSAEITAVIANSTGTATFSHSVVDPNSFTLSAVFRLTVSDGQSSAYRDVTVTTRSLA